MVSVDSVDINVSQDVVQVVISDVFVITVIVVLSQVIAVTVEHSVLHDVRTVSLVVVHSVVDVVRHSVEVELQTHVLVEV